MTLLPIRRRLILVVTVLAAFQTAISLPLPDAEGDVGDSSKQDIPSTTAIIPAATSEAPVEISSNPVQQILEDEIWQYKYPPFNDFFQTQASSHSTQVTSDESDASDSEQEPNNFLRDFPSYVIGFLNPFETDDNVRFEAQTALEQANPIQLFGSQQQQARKSQETQNTFTLDDDLWIWKG